VKKLEGKVAVVTGGNSGIGLATAKLLHQEGARVIIAGRDQASLADAAAEIGPGTLGFRCNVANVSEVDELFSNILKSVGKVDVLFANAGIAKFAPISSSTEEQYDEMLNVNLKGVFFTLQKALPHFNDGASVILNTTVFDAKGTPGASIYSASKAAVRSLARTAAAEWVGRGIRVNAVSPGPITTPIYGKLGMPKEAVDEMAKGILSLVPMKRFGKSEEIASAVLFLACSDSSYVTGVEINIDGGMGQV